MLTRFKMTNVLIALALAAVATAAADAATIRVPEDFQTIQGAIDAASPGDTILVNDGTYARASVNKADLTLLSVNGAATTFVRGFNSAYVIEIASPGVTLGGPNQGFTLSAELNDLRGGPSGRAAVRVLNAAVDGGSVAVRNNVIRGAEADWGVVLEGPVYDASVTVSDNAIVQSPTGAYDYGFRQGIFVSGGYLSGPNLDVSVYDSDVELLNNDIRQCGTGMLFDAGVFAGDITIAGGMIRPIILPFQTASQGVWIRDGLLRVSEGTGISQCEVHLENVDIEGASYGVRVSASISNRGLLEIANTLIRESSQNYVLIEGDVISAGRLEIVGSTFGAAELRPFAGVMVLGNVAATGRVDIDGTSILDFLGVGVQCHGVHAGATLRICCSSHVIGDQADACLSLALLSDRARVEVVGSTLAGFTDVAVGVIGVSSDSELVVADCQVEGHAGEAYQAVRVGGALLRGEPLPAVSQRARVELRDNDISGVAMGLYVGTSGIPLEPPGPGVAGTVNIMSVTEASRVVVNSNSIVGAGEGSLIVIGGGVSGGSSVEVRENPLLTGYSGAAFELNAPLGTPGLSGGSSICFTGNSVVALPYAYAGVALPGVQSSDVFVIENDIEGFGGTGVTVREFRGAGELTIQNNLIDGSSDGAENGIRVGVIDGAGTTRIESNSIYNIAGSPSCAVGCRAGTDFSGGAIAIDQVLAGSRLFVCNNFLRGYPESWGTIGILIGYGLHSGAEALVCGNNVADFAYAGLGCGAVGGAASLTVEENVFAYPESAIAFYDGIDGASDVFVRSNSLLTFGYEGIFISSFFGLSVHGSQLRVEGNRFQGANPLSPYGVAMYGALAGAASVDVLSNCFANYETAVYLQDVRDTSAAEIHENEFARVATTQPVGVRNNSPATGVNAENNWWGSPDGPNTPNNARTVGLVDADPFLVSLPDADGDGVSNCADVCPGTPSCATVDADGCPSDSDGDGVVDGCDQCADTPSCAVVDGNGCPIDSDGDGVADGCDYCPGTPPCATDVDGNGCPADADGDGVVDGCDECPDTPSCATVEPSGCPVDSDGDGIVDGCDLCPSTPTCASVYDDGCPLDADGDGVPDGCDECADTPACAVVDGAGCPTDSDNDGVADGCDLCAQTPPCAQPLDPDGCPIDSDGDGVPNGCDLCPDDAAKLEPGLCGCGESEADTDGDGVPDCADQCPEDSSKIAPGACGCNVADDDGDGDGVPDCLDQCPADPNKIAPGACGCGRAEIDENDDGVPDCLTIDLCPNDPAKNQPGVCGCGVPDTDSDGDRVPDCLDTCPLDRAKIAPGACGCGVADADSDGDGVPNCLDRCPNDPNKIAPGACGCGVAEIDGNRDGVPDCLTIDLCPDDPNKSQPGVCGCGVPDADANGDGVPDCLAIDLCPNDPNKTLPGVCGCGTPDTDSDSDGIPDCVDGGGPSPNPFPFPSITDDELQRLLLALLFRGSLCGINLGIIMPLMLLGMLGLRVGVRRRTRR